MLYVLLACRAGLSVGFVVMLGQGLRSRSRSPRLSAPPRGGLTSLSLGALVVWFAPPSVLQIGTEGGP